MAEEIKIYVACHKVFPVPEHPFLFPVQVGAALTQERFPGMIPDDTGENISEWNRSYCELTAQYWAWKNDTATWQGLFHYRRYLDFSHLYPPYTRVRPYWIAKSPTRQVLQRAGYEPERLLERLHSYEAVIPLPEEIGMTAKMQYATAPHHHAQDLHLMMDLLRQENPQDWRAAEEYLNGTSLLFGNIFLMRRDLFESYCDWLFPLLARYDEQKNVEGYSPQALRVDGYLAERLLGVFLTRRQKQVPIAYVPRIHFAGMEGLSTYWKKRVECFLLPPGSARRGAVRRLLRKNGTAL